MQNGKENFGSHTNIVLREWKLLRNTVAIATPMYIDTEHLKPSKIIAVSK